MAIETTIKETNFGVGDVVRVHQKISDIVKGERKFRTQVFEGTVIGIRGNGMGKSFIVRRIGAQRIGIEQIFPVESPNIEKVEVVREGKRGSRQAKLYYTRDQSKREIEKIYTRAKRRGQVKAEAKASEKKEKPVKKKIIKKKVVKKTTKKSSK